MIRKKVFLVYFKVLSWHVTAQTEEYQSAQPALHQNCNLVPPEYKTGDLTTTM
jgi:hypothetical protein